MKVFLTGGTGFVGGEIARQLCQTGHSLRMQVRTKMPAPLAEIRQCAGADIADGNILNPSSLQGAFPDCDAVIHLVGIISEVGENTFENVHVQGTRNVITAAREQGIKRFIHMSALGTRPNAVSRYHRSKWEAEEIVRCSGLDYTIFRPSLIFGPRDKFVNLFAKIIRRSPIVPILGRPDARFQPVAIQPVASAFVKSLTEGKSIGQTFDLVGPETFTMSQIIDQILAVMNRRRLKLHIPATVARLQAALLEFFFPKILRQPAPLNRDQLLMLQEDNVGNPQPANDLFGLKPVPFREALANYLSNSRILSKMR